MCQLLKSKTVGARGGNAELMCPQLVAWTWCGHSHRRGRQRGGAGVFCAELKSLVSRGPVGTGKARCWANRETAIPHLRCGQCSHSRSRGRVSTSGIAGEGKQAASHVVPPFKVTLEATSFQTTEDEEGLTHVRLWVGGRKNAESLGCLCFCNRAWFQSGGRTSKQPLNGVEMQTLTSPPAPLTS